MSVHFERIAALGFALLIVFLHGCATTQVISYDPASTPEIGYDSASASDVISIAILTPSFPQNVSVTEGGMRGGGTFPFPSGGGSTISSAGAGVIIAGAAAAIALGAVIADEAVEASRENRLKVLLSERHFSPEEFFLQRLTNELRAQGYTVELALVPRPNADFIEADIIKQLETSANVDAVLDVVVQEYGYWANAISNGDWTYRPEFAVKVQLVHARNGTVLMRRSVIYQANSADTSSHPPRVGPIFLEPDNAYQIVNFDTLEANANLAINGLRDAASQSANVIGRELAREVSAGRFYVASSAQDNVAKQFASQEGKCTVYVVYEGDSPRWLESNPRWRGAESRWLYEDGHPIGLAHPGYYSIITLDPGRHEISFSRDATYANALSKQEFDCPNGGVLYLTAEYKRQGTLRQFRYSLNLLNQNDGQRAILRSRLLRVPEEIQMTDSGPVFQLQN